jgi:hypothetical protein
MHSKSLTELARLALESSAFAAPESISIDLITANVLSLDNKRPGENRSCKDAVVEAIVKALPFARVSATPAPAVQALVESVHDDPFYVVTTAASR